jgi:pimeloyl-ACP methyl ester carboxylesterase
MKRNMLSGLLATWALLFSLIAVAGPGGANYAREQKWADEVLPGLVVGEPVYLQTPRGHHKFLALYTPVAGADRAVVVVHGMGIHPDWGMIGTLRTELADRGFATLSIQMPILAADAPSEAYPPTFPEAAARIAQAVAFLKAKGYGRLAVVSHSMGSRMSLEYFVRTPDPAVKAWASLGPPFERYAGLQLPILDLYGDNDLPPVLANAATRRRSLANPASRQLVVAGADHFYTGHEGEMVAAVAAFLDATLK